MESVDWCDQMASGRKFVEFRCLSQPQNSRAAERIKEGDLLLLIPAACNAFYAVEWKRLVPSTKARASFPRATA